MVNIETKKPGVQFYVAWVLFSFLSAITAFVVYLVFMKVYNAFAGSWIVIDGVAHIAEDYLLPYILWPMYGLLYGYLQYSLLRRYFPRMGWWFVATAASLSINFLVFDVGMFIASSLGIAITSVWLPVIQLTLVGGILGIAQWLVLRSHIKNAFWWIPANMIGWGVVGFMGALGTFALLVYPGVVPSLALYFMLNQSDIIQNEG